MRTLLLHAVRDWLFRVFPLHLDVVAGDAAHAAAQVVTARIVDTLAEAIVAKLRARYRKDARLAESVLIRTYPLQTAALIQQACTHLLDWWLDDCRRHRQAPATIRLRRILPRLTTLPTRRGRTAVDGISRLRYLIAYEDARRLLASLPRVSCYSGPRKIREDLIRHAYQRLAGRPPQSVLLARWLDESRDRLACELACWALAGTRIQPGRLRRLLPELRQLARRVDAAVKRA